METGLYTITAPNGHFYIGSTTQSFKRRWTGHRSELRRGCHGNSILQRAWNKYGEENMKFAVLLYCPPEWCIGYEQLALDTLKPAYNIATNAGTATMLKRKHTKEAKEKCRLAFIGKKRPPFSDEWKRNMSLSMKGCKKPPRTEAHRKNLSLSQKGKRSDADHPRARSVKCIETGMIFTTVKFAAKWISSKTRSSRISACCKGRSEKVGGYHWEYAG